MRQGPGSKTSSAASHHFPWFTLPPESSPQTPIHGKIVLHETNPWCQTAGDCQFSTLLNCIWQLYNHINIHQNIAFQSNQNNHKTLLENDRMEIKQSHETGIGKRTKYFLPTKNSKFILKAEKECHSLDSGDKYSIVRKSK